MVPSSKSEVRSVGVVNKQVGVVKEERDVYGAIFARISRERDLMDGSRLLTERMRNLCVCGMCVCM